MSDPFQPVRQGQSLDISARSFNGALKSAQDYSRRKMNEGREQRDGTGIDPVFPPQVYNGLADAIDEFSVLGFGSTVRSDAAAVPFEASSAPVFDAALPDANLPFMITREPVPVGAIGQVVMTGPAVVQVNITDAAHVRAVPITGDKTKLVSAAAGGVPILDRESGTGVKWCKVLLSDGGSFGASGSVQLPSDYTIVGTNVFENTGLTLTLPATGIYLVWPNVGFTSSGALGGGVVAALVRSDGYYLGGDYFALGFAAVFSVGNYCFGKPLVYQKDVDAGTLTLFASKSVASGSIVNNVAGGATPTVLKYARIG